MANQALYNQIEKYNICAECLEALHVGSANGDKEEVLTHPIDDIPFIQATSLSGAFRDYYTKLYGKAAAEALFGKSEMNGVKEQKSSNIRFTDGKFIEETVKLEIRPQLKIDSQSGTSAASKIKGGNQKSGQNFEMQYIAAGAKFQFTIYIYSQKYNQEIYNRMLQCFADIQAGNLQFGGQRSNGCGYLKFESIYYKKFDLRNQEERKKWFMEYSENRTNDSKNILGKLPSANHSKAYDIYLYGKTEGDLLVKGIAVTDYGINEPDAMNIQNAQKDYIIPASSIKGAVRNRMEMIAAYKKLDHNLIDAIFGKASTNGTDGNLGVIQFRDTIIGEKERNDCADIRTRIHIDKFTGGVMNTALFKEKNTSGELEIHIEILNNEYSDQACGLLILALRDMANGQVTLGSGYSVGRGFIHVDTIMITNKQQETCTLDFNQNRVMNNENIVSNCLKSLI